jgi:hypothetical protein
MVDITPGPGTARRVRPVGFALLVSLASMSCAANMHDGVVFPKPRTRPPATAPIAQTLPGPPGLPARALAQLGSPDAEVHYAKRGETRLIITRAEGRWLAVLTAPRKATTLALGDAPDAGAASLIATEAGYVFVWSDHSDGGGGIWVVQLEPDGSTVGNKRLLGRTGAVVRWLETFNHTASVGLIAESATGHGESRLDFIPIGAPTGSESASLQLVADRVAGWQVAGSKTDSAIAWVAVADPAQASDGRASGGQVMARGLAPTLGVVTTLQASASALADVQIARDRQSYQVAWTELTDGDTHVFGARFQLDPARASAAKALLRPVGAQVLVALLSHESRDSSLLAWERPGQLGGEREDFSPLDSCRPL